MTKGRIFTSLIILIWLILALSPLVWGWSYYITPFVQRPYHPLHDLFKPTGLVGHGLGILGSLFILVGVATYSLRKRVKIFHRFSKLNYWLHFHIFLCTLGPFWVLLHTTFKFSGIVSISFWSMMLVVSSGIFGRYVYARIPKTLDGVFLDDTEIEKRQQHLIDRLGTLTGLSGEELKLAGINLNPRKSYSIGKALVATLKFDMSQYNPQSLDEALNFQKLDGYQKQQARQLTKELAWTSSQRAIKEPFQKVFGYWHVFHIPLTAVMFLILIVHVIVAIMFGYTWIL
ncbi:MAG TPA: hypothetical protein VJ964_13765 [Balneolaceae bacterium]|nr:hypothetical protein [Balneolaceae bacterium]